MTNQNKIGAVGIAFWVIATIQGLTVFVPAATMGPSVYIWWAVVAVLFMYPYLAILSELGSSYPSEVGIYHWTEQAFGRRWATRYSWYYWANVPVWFPSTFLICTGILSELFYPEMTIWQHVVLAMALSAVSVMLVTGSRDRTRQISMVASATRLIIVGSLVIGGVWHASVNGLANPFTVTSFKPDLGTAMMYAPTLIFSIIGAELITTVGKRIRNPKRDIFRGLFWGMSVLLLLHFAGTFAVLATVPSNELTLVGGLVQTFAAIFGSTPLGESLTIVLGLLTVVTFLAYMALWCLGGSESASMAARNGDMPAVFAKANPKSGLPVGASWITWCGSALMLVIYAFTADSADALFWTIFSFAMVLYFATYFFFQASFIKLRLRDRQRHRPFKIPGGMAVALLFAISSALMLMTGIVIFIFPTLMEGQIDWSYSGILLMSVVVAVVIIEATLKQINKRKEAKLTSPENC